MKKLNAIIVDDENRSVSNLQYHLSIHCPEINIIATGTTMCQLLDIISTRKDIDVAFLDIQLYDQNIFEAIENLTDTNFRIIFVTAYEAYAIRAFKVNAFDYLLKPLIEADLIYCISRIRKHFGTDYVPQKHPTGKVPEEKYIKKLILKESEKVYVVCPKDVLFFEAKRFYCGVHFNLNGEHKCVLVSKPISQLEKECVYDTFFRVHKSYIINIDKVANIIKNDGVNIRMQSGIIIPVAKRRVNEFMSFLNKAG
ncbi:MAG: response regulator transcription factor [Bacteroidetes bacterium]|nr:response regulator transcription factor [Bacteroidota bacterium]